MNTPSITELPEFPVTGGMMVIAIAVTGSWWTGADLSFLLSDGRVTEGQVWRLVGDLFPHANVFHIGFNLWFVWALGSILERELGWLRYLATVLVMALVSSGAEFGFMSGGVGLSGVAYGLAGMLFVLSHRDPRFIGAINSNTVATLVLWFFICIAGSFTIAGFHIANVAHGMGAVSGLLIGLGMSRWPRERLAGSIGIAAVTVLVMLSATFARPWVNLSPFATYDMANLAVQALEEGDLSLALQRNQQALRYDARNDMAWHNLAVTWGRLGQGARAEEAMQRACEIETVGHPCGVAPHPAQGPVTEP